MIRARLLAVLLCGIATGCASDDTLRQFRATLAAQDSATRALQHWCGARGLMVPPHIEAVAYALVSECYTRANIAARVAG